jgi:hypothetical protein
MLSLFRAIAPTWLSLAWLLADIAVGWVGWRRGSLQRGSRRLMSLRVPAGTGVRALLVGISLVVGGLLIVALASPPNTVDSLQYHMSRVAHWSQQQSLEHYPTAFGPQLYNSIWAETAILQLRTLWGTDGLANVIQWLSMVGCLVGTLALSSFLGARRIGALVAGTFVLSIPMGILQATSTQNDYVVGLWVVCTAFFIVRLQMRGTSLDRVCLALAVGLGLLTKATYFVYAPLMILWYVVGRWRQVGPGKLAGEAIAMGALVLALNLGFWARNMANFGTPYGPLQGRFWIGQMLTQKDGEAAEPESGSILARVPVQYVAKTLKTTAYHLVTPISRVNAATLSALRRLPAIFDQAFVEQWILAAWNHEDTAGNPLHLAFALAAAGLVLIPRAPAASGTARTYALITLGTYFLLTLMIDDERVFVIRYQLPFFVMAGAIVGVAAARFEHSTFIRFLPWGFLIAAVPWVLLNNTRPLLGWKPWPTRVDSVLTAAPVEILFAADSTLLEPYRAGTRLVQEAGCTEVGLRIDSGHLEYLFWWLLRAPESGVRIESIYYPDRFKSLADPSFHPCAILCTICGDRERLHGLPLAADLSEVGVFIGPGYVADPDG